MSLPSSIGDDANALDPREASLADRALFGEPGDDLPSRLRLVDHLDEGFDCAAAALDISLFLAEERPPDALRQRVVGTLSRLAAAAAEGRPVAAAPDPVGAVRPAATAGDAGAGRWGWYAAVAAIAVAIAAWWPSTSRSPVTPDASPALFRQVLLGSPSTTLLECACTKDPLCRREGSCGDIVWNAGRGEGYLRVSGIAPNDPSEFQYQLWIVDSTRDSRYPVDGGVFDVPAGSDEVIVPIRATLPVGDAAVFAVSVERPGGVVVSDRRFVLVAEASQG